MGKNSDLSPECQKFVITKSCNLMLVFGFTITRHLKSKKGKTFLAFLDLSKAFDSLAGRFILPIMEKWYSG